MPPRRRPAVSSMASQGPVASGSATFTTPEELAKEMDTKLTINTSRGKERARVLAPVTEVSSRPTARQRLRKIVSREVDADTLAEAVQSRLAITSTDTRHIVNKEERCAEAMRSVNAASKTLSGIVEAGWKATNHAQPPSMHKTHKTAPLMSDITMAQVNKLGRSVGEGLSVIRELRPGDIDVERAASSAAGKLILLEHHQLALTILYDMIPCLRNIYTTDYLPPSKGLIPSTARDVAMLSLPLPNPDISSTTNTSLTLISTYLSQVLTTFTWVTFSQALDSSPDNATDAEPISLRQLADAMHQMPTLLHWLPYLRNLSSKYLDSTLTRTYTALVKSSSSPAISSAFGNLHAKHIYLIRQYGLLLLLGTSQSALKPSMFWDQTLKFTVAFVKSVAHPGTKQPPSDQLKEDVTIVISKAFDELIYYVEQRQDKAMWTSGHSYIAFCEYWMDLAKRAGDLDTLRKISRFIRLAASASEAIPAALDSTTISSTDAGTGAQGESSSAKPNLAQVANVCAIFAQSTAYVERMPGDFDERTIQDALSALLPAGKFLCAAYSAPQVDENDAKAAEKLWRAAERMRQVTGRVLSSVPPSSSTKQAREQIASLTRGIVEVLASVLSVTECSHADILTSLLDSLFTLAKSAASSSATYTHAFDYLARAISLVSTLPHTSLDPIDKANFLRCISGAFHNIGATIYQMGHHSHAVRFFERSCPIAEDALGLYRANSEPTVERQDSEKVEHWTTLEEQLHRRWEILAVSYLKIGDRKAAFGTFRRCIRSFPFSKADFLEQACSQSIAGLFESHESYKHVAEIMDRMTYIGLCDLFLPVEEISVAVALAGAPHKLAHPAVIGALLERQAEGQMEGKWKPVVRDAICRILKHAMEVYHPQQMPIRRSRVILKYLELAAVSGGGSENFREFEDLSHEAEMSLRSEALAEDSHLSKLRSQYLAVLKLRMAHLVHQQEQTSQFSRVVTHTQEACVILKGILSPVPRKSIGKATSPVLERNYGARKAASRRPAPATRVAPTRGKTRVAKTAGTLPKTPMARSSVSHGHVPLIPRLTFGSPSTFEDVCTLLELLHSTAHLLGLLGQVIIKVQILLLGRRISEQYTETQPDDFVKFSTELAHEYVNLGKTEKAANIYSQTWASMNNLHIGDESRILFLLRYSESLIAVGNVLKSSASYCEAQSIAQALLPDEKGMPTAQRILARAGLLERAAMATSTFSLIQYTRDDPVASIKGMLQSLRLWNRAFDALCRLEPPPSPSKGADQDGDNPFLASNGAAANDTKSPAKVEGRTSHNSSRKSSALTGIWWRIAEGLLNTLFSLTQAYVARGSPREAEFFAQQAKDLSMALNMPAMTSRALARLGEIYLHLGQLKDSHSSLKEAATLISDTAGPDAAEIRRLHAEYNRVNENKAEAQQLYDEAITVLEELENQFVLVDHHGAGPRTSDGLSPNSADKLSNDALTPSLLLSILRQNIWLLHTEGGEYQELLERVRALPSTAERKAEESALMAKLSLDDVYARLQADMFLSSLAESAITLPMGMRRERFSISPGRQEILNILRNAEKLFWSDLTSVAKRGNVFHVRDAAVSLALIRAFQDTLGKARPEGPTLAACLLDKSTAITLRREVLEVVQYKFDDRGDHDDLLWPSITPNGSPLPHPEQRKRTLFVSPDVDDTDEEGISETGRLSAYWKSLADKYDSDIYDANHLANSQTVALPPNWTVVSISVSEDKNTIFVTRQRHNSDPLIFYIPLKGRRDNEDEEHLTFDNAVAEMNDIIRLSDEGTKQAANVRNDREARATWWANRASLDRRLQELLDNIEFCWLGAFKTILSEPRHIPDGVLDDLRVRLEKIFKRNIILRDKKRTSAVRLDDALLECFASLSPKSRDEELEDLVYFILDLYQFHGIPIATAEVDIDQVVIDFRTALEDHSAKYGHRMIPQGDSHMFLVLDKNVQGIPWESIPILRGRSVSRIPSIDFLLDRVHYIRSIQVAGPTCADRLAVDPRKTYFVLNPSGDLKNTEGRFNTWLQDMKQVGWTGIVGQVPSELQLVEALTSKDLVIYFGHGGAEQYIRSRKVRHLPRCAATMLWGCSSGALKDMGAFDRTGTPYHYMLGGCPTLVANLWDVTDRDIDKFSQSVFDQMNLTAGHVKSWKSGDIGKQQTSIVTAVAQSRDACKLKYLTGAAPVVYGIPFYL